MTVPAGALSRFTVLDLTRVRSGPTAVRQLADWGARVIKIEPPAGKDSGEPMGGPRSGSDFQNLQRNKRSLTLDLKHPDGIAILKRLIADRNRTADVNHNIVPCRVCVYRGRGGDRWSGHMPST